MSQNKDGGRKDQGDHMKPNDRPGQNPNLQKDGERENAARQNRNRGSGEGEIGMDRGAGHPTGR